MLSQLAAKPNTKKNMEAVVVASKEVGLEVNPDTTRYKFMSCTGPNHKTKMANKSFEFDEVQIGIKPANQNCIHKDIKSQLNSGNASYHSLQNVYSPSMLLKNINIKTYNNIILAAVLYACEILFLTLREGYRLKMSSNKVLGITFGPKCEKVIGVWEKEHNKEFHNLYSLHITMTKSWRVRLVAHDIRMGDKEKFILSFGEKEKLGSKQTT